jgi:hypothetical protein
LGKTPLCQRQISSCERVRRFLPAIFSVRHPHKRPPIRREFRDDWHSRNRAVRAPTRRGKSEIQRAGTTAPTGEVGADDRRQAIFRRRRHQPRRPDQAGQRPAPAIGLGTLNTAAGRWAFRSVFKRNDPYGDAEKQQGKCRYPIRIKRHDISPSRPVPGAKMA